MQNKRTLQVIILILSAICLYELSFTYFTKQVEKEAEIEADGNYQLYNQYLKEKETEKIWMGNTYLECKQREINLGLDLRGGVSVTLEIDMSALVASLAGDNVENPFYQKVAAKATALQASSQDSYVNLFYEAYQEEGPEQPFATWFITRDGDFTMETTDEEVLEALTKYSEEAINQANEVLRSRVKQFGIAQPDIRKVGATGRIVVDLPGVKNLKRVRKLLQGSANLEFWDVYDMRILRDQLLGLADAYSLAYEEGFNADSAKVDGQDGDEPTSASAPEDSTDLDSAAIADGLEFDEEEEETFYNPFRVAYFRTFDSRQYPFGGSIQLDAVARVDSFLSKERNLKMLPKNSRFAWQTESSVGEDDEERGFYLLRSDRYGKPLMEGDIIKYARADHSQNGAKVVNLNFKASFVSTWETITQKSFDDKKPIAIVLDGIVFSAPVARSGAISDGSTEISGGSDGNEHWNKDLANVLNAGKFPAPAKIVEETFVGPSLGNQSIQAGFLSFAIALIVVLIYMVYYYNTAGWVANVALIANIFFIVGILAAAPTISLTLPGIAGIVLTVGMSVDANVLIYERIREELRSGKGIKNAIADGYKHSYTAILDANITTLITGIILWYFGTGVIESFAQTLVIGIFSSLFSAIFITRLVFNALLTKEKSPKFGNKVTEKLFLNSNFQFMKNKSKFYLISLVIIAAGALSVMFRGFDLGTDFKGGRTFKVQFAESVDEDEVRDALKAVFIDGNGNSVDSDVKTYGDQNKLAITTKYLYNDSTKNASQKVEAKLFEGLAPLLGEDMTLEEFKAQDEDKEVGLMQSYTVGPSIADDIVDSAFTSVIIALIAIFIYVRARFLKWQLGVGALAAIFHDVLIVLALFSIFWGVLPFSMEINQAFIAAILTVVGYSINDTVVVFDRIREMLNKNSTKPLNEVVNGALNSTISRTFNTSMTIIVVLLAILLFGGESIQGFAFALLIGVVVGTYSSLCIAAPVYVDLEGKKGKKAE